MSALPFCQSAGRGDLLFWGTKEGPTVGMQIHCAPIPMLQAHAVARTMCTCKNFALDPQALDPQGCHVLTCKKYTEAT